MLPIQNDPHLRELALIYQLDRLRDSTQEENELVGGITALLLNEFAAQFCMIALNQDGGGDPTIRSIADSSNLTPPVLETIRQQANGVTYTAPLPSMDGLNGLHLIASPFILNGVRFGVIVLGHHEPFTDDDGRLLDAAVTQIDSSIIYVRNVQQLRQRNRELELIYLIDRIRDQEQDLDDMLQRVLTELCGVVNSEVGFIAIYDEAQETRLQLKVATDGAPLTSEHYDAIHTISAQALETAKPVTAPTMAGIRSVLALPLILRDKIIGVVGALDSKRPRGFNSDDYKLMHALTSQIDTAIFERKEQRRLRKLLARAVDPKVLDHLLQRADAHILLGERVELTALFADLRGSTEWEETTSPDDLVMILNAFYDRMTDIIFRYGGTLDKYAGDQVIALFGTPLPLPDHAIRAARAAIDMQTEYHALQAEMAAAGHALPQMGIGIHSGMATAGEFGTRSRTEFTAIGPAINLCARLSGAAEGDEIIISAETRALLGEGFTTHALPPMILKGITQPIQAYRLVY
jgi:adenylate cyclase